MDADSDQENNSETIDPSFEALGFTFQQQGQAEPHQESVHQHQSIQAVLSETRLRDWMVVLMGAADSPLRALQALRSHTGQAATSNDEESSGEQIERINNVMAYRPSIGMNQPSLKSEVVYTLDEPTVKRMNSVLPFARVLIMDNEATPLSCAIPGSALLDTGASISLC